MNWNVVFLICPEVEILDLAGPLQAFHEASRSQRFRIRSCSTGSQVPTHSSSRPPNAGPVTAHPQEHTITSSSALLMEVSKHPDTPQAPDVRWWSAALSIPSGLEPMEYYDFRESAQTRSHRCRLFEHLPAQESVVTSLKDLLRDARLQEPELLYFRAHLAAAIAGFFNGVFSADTKLKSSQLIYILPAEKLTDPQALARELIAPFLSNLHQDEYSRPDASILHDHHAQGRVESIHKLGIILYEIGTWQPMAKPGERRYVSEALEMAKANAVETQNILGRNYHKSLRKCLNWQADFGAPVFEEEVLAPLQNLRLGHLLPSNEVWD